MGKTDTRQRTTWGTRFRLLVRVVGVTGLVAAAVGAALLDTVFPVASWRLELLRAAGDGGSGRFAQAAAWTLAVGAAAIAVALVVEVLGGLALVTGRRTAANATATIGAVAAAALLVCVNLYSFSHHARFDLTRDARYTLPPELVERFGKLRTETPTTIVVLQMHKTFGTLTDKRDSYTSEAERVVTDKVKDRVDLFRELGPRFNVVVFDTEAFGYDRALENLTRDAPELKAAIESAPENSILFHANKRVQRLSFNEFLQLDKTASKEAEGGRGNLVLLNQGVDTFARRILAVRERRPKAAVCVVHPALGTEFYAGYETFGTAGLKKSLEDYGFDVIDIVLRKNSEREESEPAAQTARESKLELVEAELAAAADKGRAARKDRQNLDDVLEALEKITSAAARERVDFYNLLGNEARKREWLEVIAAYRKWIAAGQALTPENEAVFRSAVVGSINEQKKREDEQLAEAEKERIAAEARVKEALLDERSVDDRRIPDVKTKLDRLLADVDLLILPRLTLMNAATGARLPPEFHTLSKDQAEAVKKFMKDGKPVLACLGPVSGPRGPQADAIDDFEKLLAERGVELGNETILFDAEARAFAAQGSGIQLSGAGASEISSLSILDALPTLPAKSANPIGAALKLTGRSVDQKFDLRFRALRPVYFADGWQEGLPFAAEFVLTGPDTWNEEKPFLQGDRSGHIVYMPRYEPTPATDPKRNTHAAERRGPFPVGVAVESKIPVYWVNEDYTQQEKVAATLLPVGGALTTALLGAAASQVERPTQRLVVFGSGNLFTGAKLDAAQEKLLLHSVNWLTGRNDRLPRGDQGAWSYPRVTLTDRNFTLWQLGTAVGLPLAAVYFGFLAMMFRRLR